MFAFESLIPPFFSGIIGAASAYAMIRINRAHADGEKKSAAENALREMLRQETRERSEWQLKREGDLAKIADILEESTEAHKLLASIAARTDSHDGRLNRHDNDFSELRQKIEAMHGHIHQLALRNG